MQSASHENLSPNGLKGNFEPGRCPPMSTDSLFPSSAKTELQHRLDICIAGRWMYEQGYNVACEGNVSVRLDDKRILTKPTCMNEGMLAPEDLVVTDLDGRQLSGQRKFSSELAMHLLFYNMRPDVNAICHAHPPTATGFAVAGRGLDQALLPEVIVGLGRIPLVRYATPGTPELSAVVGQQQRVIMRHVRLQRGAQFRSSRRSVADERNAAEADDNFRKQSLVESASGDSKSRRCGWVRVANGIHVRAHVVKQEVHGQL